MLIVCGSLCCAVYAVDNNNVIRCRFCQCRPADVSDHVHIDVIVVNGSSVLWTNGAWITVCKLVTNSSTTANWVAPAQLAPCIIVMCYSSDKSNIISNPIAPCVGIGESLVIWDLPYIWRDSCVKSIPRDFPSYCYVCFSVEHDARLVLNLPAYPTNIFAMYSNHHSTPIQHNWNTININLCIYKHISFHSFSKI